MTKGQAAPNVNRHQQAATTNTVSTEEATPNPGANTEKVPMALISIAQRNSLIEYMAKQPYEEVANGIEFLRNAPIVEVNLTINNPEGNDEGGGGGS